MLYLHQVRRFGAAVESRRDGHLFGKLGIQSTLANFFLDGECVLKRNLRVIEGSRVVLPAELRRLVLVDGGPNDGYRISIRIPVLFGYFTETEQPVVGEIIQPIDDHSLQELAPRNFGDEPSVPYSALDIKYAVDLLLQVVEQRGC